MKLCKPRTYRCGCHESSPPGASRDSTPTMLNCRHPLHIPSGSGGFCRHAHVSLAACVLPASANEPRIERAELVVLRRIAHAQWQKDEKCCRERHQSAETS